MATIDTLVDDFGTMLTEAEDLLKRSGTASGDAARELRTEVQSKLLAAKLRLQELEGVALDGVKAAKQATNEYVHENPWQAVGIAAAVGLVVGLLMNRR